MFDYIEGLMTSPSVTFTSLYGLHVEPDPNREKRVQAVIASMGDRYLLAKPIERKADALAGN
jgi:hypothetical protein